MATKYKISAFYLLRTFLIVGASSFGGYSSLVALVSKIMVEKDKTIDDNVIVKGFSIASLLPGPVAVNTVTYIGYTLRGWTGALISMFAVIFPSMIIITILGYFYTRYSTQPNITSFMAGVIPVVIALIATVAYRMGRKNLKTIWHFGILILVLAIQLLFSSYIAFMASFLIGGVLGYIFFRKNYEPQQIAVRIKFSIKHITVLLFLTGCLMLNFLPVSFELLLIEIAAVFSRVSLTLFGGGYVMIPMLNEILVSQKAWLTVTEFRDAISLGQITPGPILISATFIGYKMQGIAGAILATISIFLPSGLLMILVSELFKSIEHNHIWQAVFEGLKPVVVALIIASVLILGESVEGWWHAGVIFGLSFILLLRYEINILWLIGAAGLAGVLLL
jgi:chromate transporter